MFALPSVSIAHQQLLVSLVIHPITSTIQLAFWIALINSIKVKVYARVVRFPALLALRLPLANHAPVCLILMDHVT